MTSLLPPFHVAIIMDGNGRWAEKHHLPLEQGHQRGAQRLRNIVRQCQHISIDYLTVYAFSTENWKRCHQEVQGLMDLFQSYLDKELPNFFKNNIRIRILGERASLPTSLQEKIHRAEEKTQSNDGFCLSVALNYGSRMEILQACQSLMRTPAPCPDITESLFKSHFWSKDLPDPDLIIRTGGQQRLSNFLLWQASYSELFFVSTLWPDFTPSMLKNILKRFHQRKRLFGGREPLSLEINAKPS